MRRMREAASGKRQAVSNARLVEFDHILRLDDPATHAAKASLRGQIG